MTGWYKMEGVHSMEKVHSMEEVHSMKRYVPWKHREVRNRGWRKLLL